MSYDLETLYDLLPAVHRTRDTGALRELIGVLAEQARVLEEDIQQLYDDQFIETCAEWVVPYIGDLIGARGVHTLPGGGLSQRAQVANTLSYRRRKGTASVLEQLARDVTGWDAQAVEFFERLVTTQYMNHPRPHAIATPDLRRPEPLEWVGRSFDPVAHTLEVRRIAIGRGRFNVPNVGIFLWRLGAYKLTASPAVRVDDLRWRLHPLGCDSPLYGLPVTETTITHLAEPGNVPMALSRLALAADLERHYGPGRSLLVVVDGLEIGADEIHVCDLSDDGAGWAHTPRDSYAIDPVLGRLALPAASAEPPRVTFHLGFSDDLGGGEYARLATFDGALAPVLRVPQDASTVDLALSALGGHGAVEITDSGRHTLSGVTVAARGRLELRAADGCRPLVALAGDVTLDGGDAAELTLNGLLVTGGALVAGGRLGRLTVRHCTLVPGRELTPAGAPVAPAAASLRVETGCAVNFERSISGPLWTDVSASVEFRDGILDAGDAAAVAFAGPDGAVPGGSLSVERATVVGRVEASALPLASNAILLGRVRSGRRQEGCVRFSYVAPGSQVPRRHRCRPAAADDPVRVRPQFSSLRYGDAAYGQLSRRCAPEITGGADDEAEMGAFHELFQPQRLRNLRIRLDEYLRFGLEAGIFHAS